MTFNYYLEKNDNRFWLDNPMTMDAPQCWPTTYLETHLHDMDSYDDDNDPLKDHLKDPLKDSLKDPL